VDRIKNISYFLLTFIAATAVMPGCKHEIPVQPMANGVDSVFNPSTETLLCDSDTVYFENTILPIFVSNCSKPGCHNTTDHQEGIILNSYENIINTGDIRPFDPDHGDIVENITTNDPDDKMPPPSSGPPLTDQQVSWIIQWINQGALNNSCTECDTGTVTFAAVIYPIISAKCKGCHSGINPGGGITFLNYNDVSAQALNGALMGAITHAPGYSPMPKLAGKLPDCDIQKIGMWVNAGAPDN
jgi:hypothetical protein